MGTFGTNRTYTVGRVVKVEDLVRLGGWLRAGSIPSVSEMQNFITILAERRVCVEAFTCPCSPGVEVWHGDPYSGIRPTPGQGPA